MSHSITSPNRKMDQSNGYLPAWDIFDPKDFLRMSETDMRAVLRASGITDLPRPREGIQVMMNMVTFFHQWQVV